MSQYQQPYQGYQQQQQQMQPAPQQQRHLTKFYKSGLFLIASASGRLMRDMDDMQRQGWQLQYAANLGRNILLRQVIVTIWTR